MKQRSKYSIEALREFRRKVSQLKKAGLTSKRVDARSQKPTRYYLDKVKRLAPVLEGQAVGVKVRPDFLKTYREAGFAIENWRVVVAKRPDEILKARRGLPEFERVVAPAPKRGGLRIVEGRVVLPASVHNIHALIKDMKDHTAKWDSLKRDDELFAFTFLGNRSRASFYNADFMAEYLETYLEKFDNDPNQEVWNGLELWRIGPGNMWSSDPAYAAQRDANRKAYRRAKRRGRQNARGDFVEQAHRSRMKGEEMARREARDYQQAYRDRIKAAGGTKYEEQKRKDNARRRKNWLKRKEELARRDGL